MAMDFPASPTNGQVFISGNVTYTWNGYAWVGGIPVAGADAPSDGGEYVRVNGVWRLKEQSFNPVGVASQIIPVPTGAKRAVLTGNLQVASAIGNVLAQISTDGSTFLGGASDYFWGMPSHWSGTQGYMYTPMASSTALALSGAHDHLTLPVLFTTDLALTAPAGKYCTYKSYSKQYYAGATAAYGTSWPYGYPTGAGITIKAFSITLGANIVAGSTINVQWQY